MPVRAWRFKSSHPHSDEGPAPSHGGGHGRRRALRGRPRRARAPSPHDRGRRDAEGAAARGASGASLQSASHARYLRQLDAAQAELARRIAARRSRSAQVRWRYRLVANGFAVVAAALAGRRGSRGCPGVAAVWPNVRYHALARRRRGPEQIGADKLWGPTLATAGNGMKIGIIDDGLDATHPYFNPSGFHVPARLPEGPDAVHDAEGDRAAHVRAAVADVEVRERAVRPDDSFHATHVAGHRRRRPRRRRAGNTISGVAPNAYLGNYKALTIPTPDFGLDGNSAEIAAAIEAAVADGMNVINLSLGEPEVEPSRDIVVTAIDGAAAAGVVPVVAAGNDFADFGYGSVSSPGQRAGRDHRRRGRRHATRSPSFSSAGPDARLAAAEARRDRARRRRSSRRCRPTRAAVGPARAGRAWRRRTSPARAALLQAAPSDWTVAQIKSALVQTADPGARRRRRRGVGDARRRRPRSTCRARDDPLIFAVADRALVRPARPGATATRTVDAHRRGRRRRRLDGRRRSSRAARGSVDAPPTVTVPGQLLGRPRPPARSAGRRHGLRRAHARHRHAPHPVLARRRRPPAARARAVRRRSPRPGIVHGHDAGAPSRVSRYRYPTGGDDDATPGPERRLPRRRSRPRRRTSASSSLPGTSVPHVDLRRRREPPRRLPRPADRPQPVPRRRSATQRSIAGAVLPAPGATTSSSTRAPQRAPGRSRSASGSTTRRRRRLRSVPASRGRSWSARPTPGSGVDPSLDHGDPRRRDAARATRTARCTSRVADTGRHALMLRVATTRRRRTWRTSRDHAEHGDAPHDRRRSASPPTGSRRRAGRSSAARRGRARPSRAN